MAQQMAQPMSSQTGRNETRPDRESRRDTQGYAPGFGLYPWEPRSFARDPHDRLRNLEEDAENG